MFGSGREKKLDCITATVVRENRAMQKIFEKEGFVFKFTDDREALAAELDLRPPQA